MNEYQPNSLPYYCLEIAELAIHFLDSLGQAKGFIEIPYVYMFRVHIYVEAGP